MPSEVEAPTDLAPTSQDESLPAVTVASARRGRWFGAGLVSALGLALLVGLTSGSGEGDPWPGELVVGDATAILEQVEETGEPMFLPSTEDARIAVVAVPLTDPMSTELYGRITALVEEDVGLLAVRLVDPQLGQPTAWCSSSGWFETPTGGSSRFNRLGEWMDGPAPRGLDRFTSRVDAEGRYVIDLEGFVAGPQRYEYIQGREVWIDAETGVRVWDRSRVEGSLPFGEPRGPHCED